VEAVQLDPAKAEDLIYSDGSIITPRFTDEGIEIYQPFPTQNAFHGASEFEVLYGGSTGPGKTRAICEDAMEVALEAPGSKIVISRLKEKDVKNTTMAVFFEEVFTQLPAYWRAQTKWRASDMELKFWSQGGRRSSIKFMGLLSSAGQEDVGKIKSTSISVLYGDEITEWPEKLYLMWFTQVRHWVPGLRMNQIKMATNPEPGTWAYWRFIAHQETGKPWLPEELKAMGRRFIPALSKDNPRLPKDYQGRFDNMPKWMQKRYRDGDWAYFVGQAITNWDEDRIVIPYTPLDLYKYMSYVYIDHGQQNPCSVHRYNVDAFGNKIVDYEYYSSGRISQHCEAIKEMILSTPNLAGVMIDGSAFAKSSERAGEYWSIADEYISHDIPVMPSMSSGSPDKLKVSRLESALIYDDDRLHPFTRQKGGQELYIMDNCKNMIREIPVQKWKDPTRDGENAPEKLVDRDNHAFDDLTYFLCDQKEGFIPDLSGEGDTRGGIAYVF